MQKRLAGRHVATRGLRLFAMLALVAQGAAASDHPEEALTLTLRQRASGRNHLTWLVRTPAPPAPAADPSAVGATLRIVGGGAEVTVSLPRSGWRVRRDGTLRFANPLAPAGPSPVQRVKLRVGRDLQLRAKTTGIALDDAHQGSVSLFLAIGGDLYCSRCAAPRVDEAGRFEAKRCPAPVACSPATTTTTTTGTTTTTPGTTSTSASLPGSSTTTVTSTTGATSTNTMFPSTSVPGTTTTTATLCALVVQWGTHGSGPGQFDQPQGIATNPDGTRVYVADTNNHRIQVFTDDGSFVSALGSYGSADGDFIFPEDVGVDSGGNFFVLEQQRIQKFDPDGNFLTKWGASGSGDGEFDSAIALTVDAQDDVYVVDLAANRVQVFDGTGTFLRKWGSFGSGVGEFEHPQDIAVYDASDVYVAEEDGARRLSRFTLLGGIPDGVVSRSIIDQAHGLSTDASGHVYFGASSSVFRIDDPGLTGVAQSAWFTGFDGIVVGTATAPGNVVYGTDLLQHFVQKRLCPP